MKYGLMKRADGKSRRWKPTKGALDLLKRVRDGYKSGKRGWFTGALVDDEGDHYCMIGAIVDEAGIWERPRYLGEHPRIRRGQASDARRALLMLGETINGSLANVEAAEKAIIYWNDDFRYDDRGDMPDDIIKALDNTIRWASTTLSD